MYDKRAMITSSRAHDDCLAETRRKGGYQVSLLEQLKDEDYTQLCDRIQNLKSKLSSINDNIHTNEVNIESTVSQVTRASVKHTLPYQHQREIAPALSTFNWSSDQTTYRRNHNWKSQPGIGGSKYTTQWGEMSKYGDDPCVLMLAQKNKDKFEASRKRKTGVLG